FGPPAPFEKPVKSNTTDNDTLANGFNSTFPYPYPYGYYPPYYPYNYYYNYYQQQQYPGYYQSPYSSSGYQSKSPYESGYPPTHYPGQYGSPYNQHNASAPTFKHRPVELAAAASRNNNKWQSMPALSGTPLASKPRGISSHYFAESKP